MRTRSLLSLLLILVAASRAVAIVNCFDYAFYRATGVDPRSPSSPLTAGVGFTEIQCYLGAMGYTQLSSPALSDSDLAPGDVLLFGTAHAGFVTPGGKIDHFIQVWSTSGDKHSASALPPAKLYLPANPVIYPNPPGNKHSGNFIGHNLAQFKESAFRPAGEVNRWRKTTAGTISANDILQIEVSLLRAQAAIGGSKISDAEAAVAHAKSISGAPNCLADKIAALEKQISELKTTVTIDVNESLRNTLRQLPGAGVELQLSNDDVIKGPETNSVGQSTTTITNTPAGRVAAARAGITVKVTLKGFYPKSDPIPSSMLQGPDRTWNMTMTRTPDNPAEADPNLPANLRGMTEDEWEKKLKEIEGRLAAAEAKRAEFNKKKASSTSNAAKPADLEKKARGFLDELKKLRPAVDRVEKHCKDAAKTNKELEAIEKSIGDKEKEATKLADELLLLAGNCATAADVKKLRDGTASLQKMVKDLADPVKEARRLNDELKRLKSEADKETPELAKGAGFRKSLKEQEDLAVKAFKDAMDEYGLLSGLESEIKTVEFSISSDLFKHRRAHPTYPLPAPVSQRLDGLDARTTALVTGLSTGNAPVDTANTLGALATITSEADALIKTYLNAICTITTREDLLDQIVGSVTFTGLALQSMLNAEPQIKLCQDKLDCAAQIKKINEALDIGDLEGATSIIAAVKSGACDTSAVERRWTEISNRISFDLATARNRWRDIATTCDYRGAYEAALVIQKQYPKHPWIVKNFPDIERGYKAEEQIRELVQKLVVADKVRNYDEAERLLTQIDQIGAPFPCMVAENKKLRTEYGRGKPASPETERLCRELIKEIRAAIAARRLVEASNKLKQAQADCANVSPALFTDLGAVQRELDAAIQQAINDVSVNTGKCEYVIAHQLADQVNQVRPGAFTPAFIAGLRQQAQAQSDARTFLEPGLEAIKQKDVKGAIAALKQAQGVPNLPQCIRDNVTKLLTELEKRQSFTELTEKVQAATQLCDYKEAGRLIGEIKKITPREQYITDWLGTNEQILANLLERERKALELIRQAASATTQAESAAAQPNVDANNLASLVRQAVGLLTQADSEAPRCMPQRSQMVEIQNRLTKIAAGKRSQIAASIALLIDTSGSMSDNDKITKAKDAARRAARQVSATTEIAILSFSGECGPTAMKVVANFSTDLNRLLAAIDSLSAGGSTPMYISTAAAIKHVQDHGRGKNGTVILMSDGADTCRDQKAEASAAIRASTIPVSTIGFDVGNNKDAQNDLSGIAAMTNGRTFAASAADPREIIRAFNLAMLPSLLKDFDFGGAGSAVSGYFSQAKSMVQQQNISGALMMMQQANQLAPNSPNLNFNLSLLYEAEDQLTPAVKHANNYLRLAPGALDSSDVQNRIRDIEAELQKNPRVIMDSSGCRDVLAWAQSEREVAKRAKDAARLQGILEISIVSQRGECDKARSLAAGYKERYR